MTWNKLRVLVDPNEPGIKESPVSTSDIDPVRVVLDAKRYLQEFSIAQRQVTRHKSGIFLLGEHAEAWVPDRIKLIDTSNAALGHPYLKAHDAFAVRPKSNRYVVEKKLKDPASLRLLEGQILTPSSGRNLGPLAYVGKVLSAFSMTDIMRIQIPNETMRHYCLNFLRSSHGQALIRRGRTGSNVDHLSPQDILELPIPATNDSYRSEIASRCCSAEEKLDTARSEYDAADLEFAKRFGLCDIVDRLVAPAGITRTFTRKRAQIRDRLDAAFYQPERLEIAEAVSQLPHRKLKEIAELRLMGRYKRYYVSEARGTPIMSGRQLMQLWPVGLKFISDRSFRNASSFRIDEGWVLFTCDGRSEDSLASPSLVGEDCKGWMASNHIMRAIAIEPGLEGLLYLALNSEPVQQQLTD